MRKTCISKDWLFYKQPACGGKVEAEHIDLPHDYSITQPRDKNAPGGGSNGYFVGGVGIYKKTLVPQKGVHHILDVEGAYANAEYKLNGSFLGNHPHGYTPFLLDLTDYLHDGENELEIKTDDMQCSTRWYSGAGIYRDVFVWTGGSVRIEPWDAHITTPIISDNFATVQVDYTVSSDIDGKTVLSCEITDENGNTVADACESIDVFVGKNSYTVSLTVNEPHLWNIDAAYLYTLHTKIEKDGEVTDEAENIFGIRSVTADSENGLRINGKTVKLRGGCIHHDHGVLGAACFRAAEERKIRKLKEAGFNALRIAHNPPSLILLELCDRLGIIVMDEAFDMWRIPKNVNDYSRDFDAWWERDIAYMVMRDRNHPCVIAFSTGNEIPESKGTPDGYELSARLAAKIREYDNTHLVTSCTFQMGDEESWADRTQQYYAPYDICGYNYLYERYAADGERFPKRVIWGSETHAINIFNSWSTTLACPHVIGDFTWTAYDNLGEAGTGRALWARDGYIPGISVAEYPWRTCYQGDFDLCGNRRPQSYLREAVWLGNADRPRIFTTHPEHTGEDYSGTGWHFYDVLDTWTFDDAYLGKPTRAEVYTDADEVEWILNGKSYGRTKTEKAISAIMLPYEKGSLVAVTYKDGNKCGSAELHTVGAPVAIRVQPEKPTFTADYRDLCYFSITVEDERGDRIPDDSRELTCHVEGGELLGIFSGDPKNEDEYGTNRCHAFLGRATAIVRTRTPGKVSVTVENSELKCGSATVEATKA